MQAAQFAAMLPDLRLHVATLLNRLFNLIERGRLEQVWLPIIERISLTPELRNAPKDRVMVQLRKATLLRLANEPQAANSCLQELLTTTLEPQQRGYALLDLSESLRKTDQLTEAQQRAAEAYGVV